MSSKPRVVVLGSGLAAFETLFSLSARLHGRADLRICGSDEFLFRPSLVHVPFGADPDASRINMEAALFKHDITLEEGRPDGVDADAGRVRLAGGRTIPYEHLVVATGATARAEAVPGLREHAVSLWEPAAALELRQRFTHVRGRARGGAEPRVLFVLAPGAQCSLPLYEVALMLDTWLRRERAREPVSVGFVTHEAGFGEVCGPRMHEILAREFVTRGIDARVLERLVGVDAHEASFAGGRTEAFEVLATIPPLAGAVCSHGLPADEHGFLRVEPATRQLLDHPEIYAVGGAADFPLKHPFLSLLQADAAADHLAAVITDAPFERPFDPVTTNVIDMLDRAAFARLALEETGDPDHPVRLRAGGGDDYEVGVSRAARLAKRTFASSVLMRFAAGEPVGAGAGRRLFTTGPPRAPGTRR